MAQWDWFGPWLVPPCRHHHGPTVSSLQVSMLSSGAGSVLAPGDPPWGGPVDRERQGSRAQNPSDKAQNDQKPQLRRQNREMGLLRL